MQTRRNDIHKSPSKGSSLSHASGARAGGFLPRIDVAKKLPDWAADLSPRNGLSRNPPPILRKGSNNFGVDGVANESYNKAAEVQYD